MRVLKWVLLGLVLAVLAAGVYLWHLPADVGYRLAVKRVSSVVLSGIRGTVWDGHADGISVFGNDLGEIDWQLPKWAALSGKPVADVRIKGSHVELAGQVERLGRGWLGAHDLRFSVPASMFEPLFGAQSIQLQGMLAGVLKDAELNGINVRKADGTLRWSGVGIRSERGELKLSDLLVEFSSQADGSIAGSVKDEGSGALAVDGRFTLRPPMFDAQATLRARNGDPQTQTLLHSLGEVQADGSVLVHAHGSMLAVR